MVDTPKRNESRFYRYPANRVVGILDDGSSLEAAVGELGDAGVEVSRVAVLSGPEGARLLDLEGVRHGLRARVLRWLQRAAYEIDTLRAHDAALRLGRHVVYVPVGKDDVKRVADVLRRHGGHDLLYFSRTSIEQLPRW